MVTVGFPLLVLSLFFYMHAVIYTATKLDPYFSRWHYSAFTFSLTTRQCRFRFRSRFHCVVIFGMCLCWCLQISVCTFNFPESTAWFHLKLLRVSLVTSFIFYILYPKALYPHLAADVTDYSKWMHLLLSVFTVDDSFEWGQVYVFVLNALLCSLWISPHPPHAVIYASTCNESTFQQPSHWRLQVRSRFIIRQVTAFVFFFFS